MVAPSQPNALDIHAFLRRRAHELFAEEASPDLIEITRHQSVWLAQCRFHQRVHSGVVKWFGPTTSLGELSLLCRVHDHLRQVSSALRDSMVNFLGFDSDRCLVALEKVEGVNLEQIARAALPSIFDGEATARARCEIAMRQVGHYLRAVHSFDAEGLELDQGVNDTSVLLAEMQQAWRLPGIASRLPAGFRDPDALLERLPADLFVRACDRLLPVDLQPKNVMVTQNNRICVIDVDYTLGHPARSLGMVLTSIDLTTLRRPDRQSLRLAEQWKTSLLAAYAADADQQWIIDDLLFFYPRAILALHRRHVTHRPYWRRSLDWYYARLLRRFLERLDCSQSGVPWWGADRGVQRDDQSEAS